MVCLQNHDQVGNRAVGDRLPGTHHARTCCRVGAVLLLTSPFTPMLWMGEEWAASTRWPFFTSHPEPELAAATGEGRLEEFAGHGWDVDADDRPAGPARLPERDPELVRTPSAGRTARCSSFYRDLIALRAAEPDLRRPRPASASGSTTTRATRWVVVHRGSLRVAANLADSEQSVPVLGAQEVIFATGAGTVAADEVRLPAHSAAIVRVA